MSDAPSRLTRVVLPFLILILLWGSTWVVILGQLGTVPPSWSVTYRFMVATLVMLVYVWATKAPLEIGAGGHWLAIFFGVAQFSLNFNFVYEAERFLTSGLVAVSFSSLLVFNAILSRVFLKVPVSRTFIIGSAVAMSGIALLFYNEFRVLPVGDDAGDVLVGLGYTLAAIVVASAANVMQATSRARALPISSLLVWGMFYGVVANAVLALILAGPPTIEPTIGYFAGIFYLGALASALAFPLYFGLIREMGPAKAAYTGVVTPVIAMMLSTVIEDYRWSAYAVGGCLLAVTGLVIALRERRPPPRPQPFGRDG